MSSVHRLISRFLTEPRLRAVALAVGGLAVNLIYAFYFYYLGVRYRSFHGLSSAVYYTLLSSARLIIALEVKSRGLDGDMYSVRIRCGRILTGIGCGLAAAALVFAFITGEQSTRAVTLLISVYTLVRLILTVFNRLRAEKQCSELLTTVRSVSAADALVSSYSLLCSAFGLPWVAEKGISLVGAAELLLGLAVSLTVIHLGRALSRQRSIF